LAYTQFIFNDEFVKSKEFKYCVTRSRREEFHQKIDQAKVGVAKEKYEEVSKKFCVEINFDTRNITQMREEE
jgi:hypothetical protein